MINTYYLMEDGQQTGPFSHHELMDRGLAADVLVLSPITNEWESAATLPEFADYFESRGIYYPTQTILASFWWRLLAYLIDYILLLLFSSVVGVVIGLLIVYAGIHLFDGETNKINQLGERLLIMIALYMYNAVFESTALQGSIGKTVCKLKVVNAEGGRINFSIALGRNFGKILSGLLLGMGFLNIFWDKNRQGWHDQWAKTFIIKRT